MRTIGQYRVTGLIGQGGMGAVCAGEHVLLGRPAAIKILLPELSQQQEAVMRFFNEARAAAAIRHPGIVEIYDFGWSDDGAAFIAMERLEGEALSRRVARGRLGWRAALPILRQIAGALGAAHVKGIVHRDLKPDNIFLVHDPEVPGGERIKLLDFGIAKLIGDSSSGVNVTRVGAVMGTPTYMSPEQCRGLAVDHRADLYALGCIAFELCAGRPPFDGEGTGDVLAAHIYLPVPSLEALANEVPYCVAKLIQRLLAKSPTERIQSAEELIRAIDAITADDAWPAMRSLHGMQPPGAQPSLTTLSGAASAAASRPRTAGSRNRLVLVGLAAIAVLTFAILVMVVQGRDDKVARASSPPVLPEPHAAAPPVPVQPPRAPSSTMTSPPAHLDPAPPAATAPPEPPTTPPAGVDVVIESAPGGAQILLDGAVLGKTPYHGTLPRQEGSITLVVRLTGYVDRRVVVAPTQSINIKLKLVRIAPVRSAKDSPDESVNPF